MKFSLDSLKPKWYKKLDHYLLTHHFLLWKGQVHKLIIVLFIFIIIQLLAGLFYPVSYPMGIPKASDIYEYSLITIIPFLLIYVYFMLFSRQVERKYLLNYFPVVFIYLGLVIILSLSVNIFPAIIRVKVISLNKEKEVERIAIKLKFYNNLFHSINDIKYIERDGEKYYFFKKDYFFFDVESRESLADAVRTSGLPYFQNSKHKNPYSRNKSVNYTEIINNNLEFERFKNQFVYFFESAGENHKLSNLNIKFKTLDIIIAHYLDKESYLRINYKDYLEDKKKHENDDSSSYHFYYTDVEEGHQFLKNYVTENGVDTKKIRVKDGYNYLLYLDDELRNLLNQNGVFLEESFDKYSVTGEILLHSLNNLFYYTYQSNNYYYPVRLAGGVWSWETSPFVKEYFSKFIPTKSFLLQIWRYHLVLVLTFFSFIVLLSSFKLSKFIYIVIGIMAASSIFLYLIEYPNEDYVSFIDYLFSYLDNSYLDSISVVKSKGADIADIEDIPSDIIIQKYKLTQMIILLYFILLNYFIALICMVYTKIRYSFKSGYYWIAFYLIIVSVLLLNYLLNEDLQRHRVYYYQSKLKIISFFIPFIILLLHYFVLRKTLHKPLKK